MKIEQKKWTPNGGWKTTTVEPLTKQPSLVLVFGGTDVLKDVKHFQEVHIMYPNAHVVMCSTAGEILGQEVTDGTLALTAIDFEKTTLQFAEVDLVELGKCAGLGKALADALPKKKIAAGLPAEGLVHVLVFSDGLRVNGTSLVRGLTEVLPKTVAVTGGLVGDGSRFQETVVGLDTAPVSGKVVLIGLYGDIKIGYGSLGGWDAFGPERLITKSVSNVLYEVDNKPALALYKEYLGDEAKGLPGSGLLFPMSLRMKGENDEEIEIVRTLLAVDEETQSMTFAGDMPEGIYAKLMKVNIERLIDGATGAASMSMEPLGTSKPDLALLVSCVGRKLVLKSRVEDEVEAVSRIVGDQAAMTGFYSYGEICPIVATEKQCQLHNQTMTITTFRE